ncbi:MAG TPA: 50S ribosomal protein L9 [Chloroflexota bacterium]|nr:50S ribosomal protein L9 [Chloroflexota bacterium]
MAVKVILKQSVPNLGEAGDVKQVAPGYFRNFLLPRGLAVEASASQLKALQNTASAAAGQMAKGKQRASELAGKIAEHTVRIPVRLGEQGRIYGSVTNKDIAEALAEQAGVTVDRHKIDLPEPLKAIGGHIVPLKLEHGVEARVNVELVPEGELS